MLYRKPRAVCRVLPESVFMFALCALVEHTAVQATNNRCSCEMILYIYVRALLSRSGFGSDVYYCDYNEFSVLDSCTRYLSYPSHLCSYLLLVISSMHAAFANTTNHIHIQLREKQSTQSFL